MKQCRYCDEWYTEDKFELANIIKGKEYRRHKCKKCKQAQQLTRAHAIRDAVRDIKKASECSRCGFDNWKALDFHHLDSKQKEFSLGDGVRYGYGMKRILNEISKCEIVCSNCHRIETIED